MARAYTQYTEFFGTIQDLNSELRRMQQEDKVEIKSIDYLVHCGNELHRWAITFHITIDTDDIVKMAVETITNDDE